MKLTNEDIAFIAEMRTEGISWPLLSFTYKMPIDNLKRLYYWRLNRGMIYGKNLQKL